MTLQSVYRRILIFLYITDTLVIPNGEIIGKTPLTKLFFNLMDVRMHLETNTNMWFLKTHLTVHGHKWNKHGVYLCEKRNVRCDKLEVVQVQKRLQKVWWGDKIIENCWQFECLGSMFQSNGDHMSNVKLRIIKSWLKSCSHSREDFKSERHDHNCKQKRTH